MKHKLFYNIFNSSESLLIKKKKEFLHCNWNHITMKTFLINNNMILHWGYRIRFLNNTNNYFYSKTYPIPYFNKNKLIGFKQYFDNNISFNFICDENHEFGDMTFLNFENNYFIYKLYCNEFKLFNNQKSKFKLNIIK